MEWDGVGLEGCIIREKSHSSRGVRNPLPCYLEDVIEGVALGFGLTRDVSLSVFANLALELRLPRERRRIFD